METGYAYRDTAGSRSISRKILDLSLKFELVTYKLFICRILITEISCKWNSGETILPQTLKFFAFPIFKVIATEQIFIKVQDSFITLDPGLQ